MQDAEVFIKKTEKSASARSETPSPVPPAFGDSDSTSDKSRPRNRSLGKAEAANLPKRQTLPCRFAVKVSGVEAFLYNQSPVYDNIISNLAGHSPTAAQQSPTTGSQSESDPDVSSTHSFAEHQYPNKESAQGPHLEPQPTASSFGESIVAGSTASHDAQSSLPAFLKLFPIQIDCKKAAAAVGNEHTTSVVTAKLDFATGRIDADEAGTLDLYRLLFKFDFTNVNVCFKPNHDFQMYQLQAAAQHSKKGGNQKKKKGRSFFGFHPIRRVRKILASLRCLFSFGARSTRSVRTASLLSNDELVDKDMPELPGEAHWQGLARYLDESGANEHHEWDNIEYARFSQIADCKKVAMNFYWDVPGMVRKRQGALLQSDDGVNGCEPPAYGLDLSVEGGFINYGPWADRQRVVLQNVFFPVSYCDARPAQHRSSDQIRLATVFKLRLCLDDEVQIRVPTRESSKDWQWQGRTETHRKPDGSLNEPGLRKRRGKHSRKPAKTKSKQPNTSGANVRPFGWIDVKIKANSTVNYSMDMYARKDGFRNSLDVDVKGTEIFSSVNHALLWRAGNLSLQADLSNPLAWNALRKWKFSILCHDLNLYILRDHMFLLTDLITDWGAGPPPDFYTFVPYHYSLDINFDDFKLFLNGNDANIVNNPSDLEENNFLIIEGQKLHAELGIPIDQYRPAQGEVVFDVTAHDLSLDLSNSPKITLHSLLRQKTVASLKRVTLSGSHTYFVQQSPGLTDVLRMDICGSDLELQLFGFLIRFFVNVKENYFGEFLHFKTLEEYQNSGIDASNTEASVNGRYAFRPANDLDVILCITAEHPVIKLPCNIYSCDTYIKAELPTASADLRVTNYYLDLQTDVSPVAISWSGLPNESGDVSDAFPQLRIDHANISGHRLFGLPPTEPAYVENWDVQLGDVSGDCSLEFVQHMVNAGRSFAFALTDRENALPLAQTTPIPSMMFLRLNTGSLGIWINCKGAAFQISSKPINLVQNDRADHLFSSRMSLVVPDLTAMCVKVDRAARHRIRNDDPPAKCMAFIQTSVEMNILTRKAHFEEQRSKQQQHVRRQDSKSLRAHFLLRKFKNDRSSRDRDAQDDGPSLVIDEPPSMSLPTLPPPLYTSAQGSQGAFASIKSSVRSFKSVGTRPLDASDTYSRRSHEKAVLPSRAAPGTLPTSNLINAWSPFASVDSQTPQMNVDLSGVPTFTPYEDDEDDISMISVGEEGLNLDADDDCDHETFIIRLRPGIRAYAEPRISGPILEIIDTALPKSSIDIVDKFQMDVMGRVEADQQRKGKLGKITELNLIVPTVDARIFNEPDDCSEEPLDTVRDQLDLNLSYLNLTLRNRTAPYGKDADSALLLHLTLDSALIKLKDNPGGDELVRDAIRLGVDDVLVWLLLSKTRSVHVSFKDLLTAVSVHESAYLASVFSRYARIGTSIQERSDRITHKAKARLRYMADFLTEHSSVSSDPPYLSRMTYILRAFPSHFRNQDSWKIVARFRHIYDSLSPQHFAELENALLQGRESNSKPATILDQWAEWCSWDIPNVGQTHVFKLLLDEKESEVPEENLSPTELTLRSETVRLSLETGERSSEVSLGGLSLGLQIVPPSRPSGLMLVEDNLRTKTVVQAHTAAIVIRLNWEIVDQADQLIEIYFAQIAPVVEILPDNTTSSAATNPETDESNFRQDYHIVLSNDQGTIELDTINLKHVSKAEDMKFSLIGTSRASQDYGKCISILLNTSHAFTELRNKASRIWRTDLTLPSIYFDYRAGLGEILAEINVGGSYGELKVNVEQEVLTLLETVDSVFVDEVAAIKGLQRKVDSQQRQARVPDGPATPTKPLLFNVAFLAGNFTFNLTLLQALRLSIAGDTANLRVKPKRGSDMSFDIEAHVGSVEYSLNSKADNAPGKRAVFHTPPISALVGLQITEKTVYLTLAGILQEVSLEAPSVQSALTILNRPEVQGVLEAISDQIVDVRQRIAEVLASQKPVLAEAVAKEAKVVVYDIKATIAGLKVLANAPALSAGKARAELSFGLGLVRGTISNKGLRESTGLPNIHAQVHDIGAVLHLVENNRRSPCGHVLLSVNIDCLSHDGNGSLTREIKARSDSIDINVFAETASTVVDIVTHVQRKILDLDLSREVDYLRRLRHSREKRKQLHPPSEAGEAPAAEVIADGEKVMTNFSLDLRRIRLAWVTTEAASIHDGGQLHDLELSLTRIHLTVHRQNEARLSIQNLQLQIVPKHHPGFERAENSALLPEVVFTVRYATAAEGVMIAFNAAGQALELRLDAKFVAPLSVVQKSISTAIEKYHNAAANWRTESAPSNATRRNPFGDKRLLSLQADAKFDGAHFYIQGDPSTGPHASFHPQSDDVVHGRTRDEQRRGSRDAIATSLRAPGVALKLEFSGDETDGQESTLNGELKVDASSNTVYPQLVPIILQISDGVKEVVRSAEERQRSPAPPRIAQQTAQDRTQDLLGEDSLLTKDPSALIGKLKLNLGLRICQQEFGLSCQPIARVNAKAHIEDIYITMNTIESSQFGHFFALSATVTKVGASVQHVYSRESTFSFEIDSVALSLMNSKHLNGGLSGISAALNIAPTRTALNVRQIQDLLLFREIWFPQELRNASSFGADSPTHANEEMLVQKYHQVSAAAAFPWSATVAIADLAVDLELGQSIGKSSFNIKKLWACSKKASSWKQDLCIGLDEVGIQSTGRMSGFVDMSNIAVRTSIEWPSRDSPVHKAPLIQAAAGFSKLRAKVSFDYQPFAFVDIEGFNLLMYNVRDGLDKPDRLVAILDGDKFYAFCSATSAAQGVGLYQAFNRLVQEKQAAYKESMRDLQRQLQRRSSSQPQAQRKPSPSTASPVHGESKTRYPITLHTDVVVKLRAISVGAFPGTFFDNQILKLEASDVQARFAVGLENDKIHSTLGLTLGQLVVALASIKRVSVPKVLGDISIDEVIANATGAKGGTILRVPKVVANMQTWQSTEDNYIDYLFRSSFEGKVDVGWNYSRISFIRGMWNTHSRTLAARLGKPLPESAVKIKAGSERDETSADAAVSSAEQQGKITAVVNVPQSRYEYRALEPPIIETPQLRDMGEATPPLEWMGLHRDRLPNVAHQIIIVTLLEVAKEVEDAYSRILGSS